MMSLSKQKMDLTNPINSNFFYVFGYWDEKIVQHFYLDAEWIFILLSLIYIREWDNI